MTTATALLRPLVCVALLAGCAAANLKDTYGGPGELTAQMQLTSSAFVSHQPIPLTYTCDGDEVTPPLRWSNVPSEARSLVLLVDDPDAGRGVFTHWLVYNLTPGSELSEGARALPRGASEGMNDRGTVGYVGPCPPSGRHHYHFKIYALDTFINGLDSPTRDQIEAGMQGHILATGELVGTYQREAVEQ